MSFSFNEVVSALTHIRGGIPARRLSSRIRLGEHRSRFFGPSYDFYDIQEYDPERDPPNQIVSALIGDDEEVIFARKCIEPHEVKMIFLTDLSSSIDSGVAFTKRKLLLESMGYIGMTAVRYQDPVGLLGFTDKVVINQPARCGNNNFIHLLRTVYDFMAQNDQGSQRGVIRKTDFFAAFNFIRKAFNRPCFIPVISDFVGFEKLLSSSALKLMVAKHELIFIFLDNPAEYVLPRGGGYMRVRDVESGEELVVARRKLLVMQEEIRQRRKALRKELSKIGIDSVVLESGKHFNRLHRFFTARYKRTKRGH